MNNTDETFNGAELSESVLARDWNSPEEDAADVAWLKRARRKKLHFRPLEEVLADLP